jgi:hypothetical protein
MQIVFNGKAYNSLAEMPANERMAYEQMQKIFVDANGNGIPDFLEGDIARNVMTALTTNVVNYDGKVYNSLDELPADARQKVQDAFAKLNQMGIINVNAAMQDSSKHPAFEFAFQPSKPLIPQEPAIGAVGRMRGLVLIIAIVAALIVCATGAALFLFAR